ncbi:MAG TPA: hypothetical protein ENH82_14610 [bacterium]|nr:hypothetical protein [bacterium]
MEKKVSEYENILSKAKERLWGGIDAMRIQLNGAVGNLKNEVTDLIRAMSENISQAFDKHGNMLKDIEDKVNENDKKDERRDEAITNLKEDVRELRK